MSDFSNATDGRQYFRNALKDFKEIYCPIVQSVRQKFSANPTGKPPPSLEDLLEAHGRNYLVNELLTALNWRIRAEHPLNLANLVPEAPIGSLQKSETRYLDYLGLEQQTTRPLLIVEAKRPLSPLPRCKKNRDDGKKNLGGEGSPDAIQTNQSVQEAILQGLCGDELLYEWNEWLTTLKDYYSSVKQRGGIAPARVLLTDGNWCVLFVAPESTLLDPKNASIEHIRVYEPQADQQFGEVLEAHFQDLYGEISYAALATQVSPIRVSEIAFCMAQYAQLSVMRGLRLKYRKDNEIYSVQPTIVISPVLFLRSNSGPWFQVEGRSICHLPNAEEDLAVHLAEVHENSDGLVEEVRTRLNATLAWVPLVQHYSDAQSLSLRPGVKELAEWDDFVLVTGESSHYLRAEPTIQNCQYHNWNSCQSLRVQNPMHGAVGVPSIPERAFFVSPGKHHCAHADVAIVKSHALARTNRQQCGPRSGGDGAPFCEIWQFEHFLCCRTCVFEEVCSQATVFRLPCPTAGPQNRVSPLIPI